MDTSWCHKWLRRLCSESCSATQRVQLVVLSDIIFTVHITVLLIYEVQTCVFVRSDLLASSSQQRSTEVIRFILMMNATRKSICFLPSADVQQASSVQALERSAKTYGTKRNLPQVTKNGPGHQTGGPG
jgi:hypothetical protein